MADASKRNIKSFQQQPCDHPRRIDGICPYCGDGDEAMTPMRKATKGDVLTIHQCADCGRIEGERVSSCCPVALVAGAVKPPSLYGFK